MSLSSSFSPSEMEILLKNMPEYSIFISDKGTGVKLDVLEDSLGKLSQEELETFSKIVKKKYSEHYLKNLFMDAIKGGYPKVAEMAILAGVPYKKMVDYGDTTPLETAIMHHRPQSVEVLLRYGVDPSQSSVERTIPFIPLKRAIVFGNNPLILKYLLDAGANIEGTFGSDTPLMTAVMDSYWKSAEYLIDRGAQVTSKGESILIAAVTRNKPNLVVIEKLLKNGADIFAVEGRKDVLEFAKRNHPRNKKLLILLRAYKEFYLEEIEKELSEHMIPDLAKITTKSF